MCRSQGLGVLGLGVGVFQAAGDKNETFELLMVDLRPTKVLAIQKTSCCF